MIMTEIFLIIYFATVLSLPVVFVAAAAMMIASVIDKIER